MRLTDIDDYLRQRPFVPFLLRMSDGVAYEVRHPEMVILSRTVVAVGVHRTSARFPERIILCDPIHIIRLEPLDGRAKGRRPRRK